MYLRFAPLVSGSSGNCVYVGVSGTHILVDAGMSLVRLLPLMHEAGLDPRDLAGVLVTHEHSDHSSGVGVISRKFNLPIYATEGTWQGMERRIGKIAPWNVRVIAPGENFYIGRIDVMPFPIPHDANEPVGFSFTVGGMKCAVATDIGCIKDAWLDEVSGSDILLLESNHDVDMLHAGPYPYDLKKRILGKRGHLSNEDSGRAAALLVRRGVRHIILGHLSRENNVPELAYLTVCAQLKADGLEPGVDVGLDIARRDGLCGVYSLEMGGIAGE